MAGINDEEEKLFAERVKKAASYYADGEINMIGIEDFKSIEEMKLLMAFSFTFCYNSSRCVFIKRLGRTDDTSGR